MDTGRLVEGIIGAPGFSATVQMQVYGWDSSVAANIKTRLGRPVSGKTTSDVWANFRWVSSSGKIAVHGEITESAGSAPVNWSGVEGTLAIRFDQDRKVAYPVKFLSGSDNFETRGKNKMDRPQAEFTMVFTGPGVPSDGWNGTYPTEPTAPTPFDQEQYAGTSKTYDPNGLLTGATRLTDIWGNLANTDAAELTRITTLVAAAQTPITGLKLRTVTFARDANDGGTAVETWGLTSTTDDVVNPATVTSPDVSHLQDSATIAQVTTSGTAPSVPDAPVGQHVGTETIKLNDGKWRHVFKYGNSTSQQQVEFDGAVTDTDVSGLSDVERFKAVASTSTPPSDPSPTISGLILRRRVANRIGGTPEKWLHTWEFARKTAEQEITFPGTITRADSSSLRDEAAITKVTTSSDPSGDTPSVPLGVLVAVDTEQLTDAGKWRHTWTYRNSTSQQAIEFDGTATDLDPSVIDGQDKITLVNDSSTPPADPTPNPTSLVLRRCASRRIGGTPERWSHTFLFTVLTAQQEIEYLQSKSTAEASTVQQEEIVVRVQGSGTPDDSGLNPDATNLSLHSTESHQVTASKWVHIFRFSPLTVTERIAAEAERDDVDPASLEDENIRVILDTNASAPSAPAISGKTCDHVTTRRYSKTKYLHTYHYSYRTSALKLAAEKTRSSIDPADLESEQFTAAVWTGSAPSTPSAPSGLKLVETIDTATLNPSYTLRIYRWGKRTSQDRIEQEGTIKQDDPNNIKDAARVTQVTSSSTPPTTPSAPVGKCIRTDSQQLDDVHWVHTFHYAPWDSADELTLGDAAITLDPIKGQRVETPSLVSATTTTALATAVAADITAHATDKDYAGARGKLLPGGKAQIVSIKDLYDDKRIHSTDGSVPFDSIRGVPYAGSVEVDWATGWGSGNAASFIMLQDLGSGQNKGVVVQQKRQRQRRIFSYRRRFTTDGSPETYFHLDLVGKVNDAAFLGEDTHWVMYVGYHVEYAYGISGEHVMIIDYKFEVDEWLFVNDGYLPIGEVSVLSSSYAMSASALYPATNFLVSGVFTWPAEADFSVFTT